MSMMGMATASSTDVTMVLRGTVIVRTISGKRVAVMIVQDHQLLLLSFVSEKTRFRELATKPATGPERT